MKSLTKIASVMLALFLALCFVSCKKGPAEVASFKGTIEGEELIITFYDDATISYGTSEGSVGGTYTGDVSKDGEGTFEIEGTGHEYDWKLEGDKFTFGQKLGDMLIGFTLTRI